MTSLGNSIASGYSMVGRIIPLLYRNDSISGVMKENEIFKFNRVDYGDSFIAQPHHGLDEDKINKYYGLKDLVLENDPRLLNVVIYNGGTGPFLDAVTRGGKFYSQGTYGLKRAASNIESSLSLIQSNNRKHNGNTQVYLCGALDYLGIKFTNLILD